MKKQILHSDRQNPLLRIASILLYDSSSQSTQSLIFSLLVRFLEFRYYESADDKKLTLQYSSIGIDSSLTVYWGMKRRICCAARDEDRLGGV